MSALYRRLVWLTAFRLLTVTALLAATVVLSFRAGDPLTGPVAGLLYGLIAAMYALSLGYIVTLRRRSKLGALALGQIAGDVLTATFLVYLTGGPDSLFTILYPLAIVNAAVVLHRRGAVMSAIASALLFSAVSAGLWTGFLPPAATYLAAETMTGPRFALDLIANGSAFVLTAALASYLADQLRAAGERVTEAEAGFAQLSALHEAIVRSVPSGILTTDARGRVTFMNPAAEKLAGLALADVRGRELETSLPALAAALASRLAAGEEHGEASLRPGAPVAFTVSPLSGAPAGSPAPETSPTTSGGRMGGAQIITLEDLTTIRRMEDAVRRAEGLAAAGKLAAGLAHEIRNPLASMCGSVELLRGTFPVQNENSRLLDIVLREGERLNALVTDFLAFARPSPPALSEVELGEVVGETLKVFANDPQAARVSISSSISGGLIVRGDAAQIRQALWNLLANSAQAQPDGGAVTVTVAAEQPYAVVHVTDQGPGIDAADLSRIFEPFFTTKEKGTGLGLATVHRIVDGLGGRVDVVSEPGRGARFSLRLPLRELRLRRSVSAA